MSEAVRKQVNVRLSDEEYEKLVELSKAHNNKSKSEIVREAFKGELAKIDSKKNKTLSEEERKDILVTVGTMMTFLSDVRNHTTGMGRNINQIAKLAHEGEVGEVPHMDEYVAYSENVKENLQLMSEELNRIWHTLV